ncbi:unnamed protein product [Acanthosepion pharaonis]|uniref:Uncharacterized protein n=1 Tax=Acanthosepion pharaonis TaxID=158019 RepID=A0A812D7M3_ACAPH|nr:unnamed protein product [Sepia pharaonis]
MDLVYNAYGNLGTESILPHVSIHCSYLCLYLATCRHQPIILRDYFTDILCQPVPIYIYSSQIISIYLPTVNYFPSVTSKSSFIYKSHSIRITHSVYFSYFSLSLYTLWSVNIRPPSLELFYIFSIYVSTFLSFLLSKRLQSPPPFCFSITFFFFPASTGTPTIFTGEKYTHLYDTVFPVLSSFFLLLSLSLHSQILFPSFLSCTLSLSLRFQFSFSFLLLSFAFSLSLSLTLSPSFFLSLLFDSLFFFLPLPPYFSDSLFLFVFGISSFTLFPSTFSSFFIGFSDFSSIAFLFTLLFSSTYHLSFFLSPLPFFVLFFSLHSPFLSFPFSSLFLPPQFSFLDCILLFFDFSLSLLDSLSLILTLSLSPLL